MATKLAWELMQQCMGTSLRQLSGQGNLTTASCPVSTRVKKTFVVAFVAGPGWLSDQLASATMAGAGAVAGPAVGPTPLMF